MYYFLHLSIMVVTLVFFKLFLLPQMPSSLAFLVKSSFQEQPEGHPLSLVFPYSFSYGRIHMALLHFSFP